MNKYDDVGFESGRLPEDLKHYGRRMATREDVVGAIIGVIGAALFIGFLLGQLWR